jgi:hypothetical protein
MSAQTILQLMIELRENMSGDEGERAGQGDDEAEQGRAQGVVSGAFPQ